MEVTFAAWVNLNGQETEEEIASSIGDSVEQWLTSQYELATSIKRPHQEQAKFKIFLGLVKEGTMDTGGPSTSTTSTTERRRLHTATGGDDESEDTIESTGHAGEGAAKPAGTTEVKAKTAHDGDNKPLTVELAFAFNSSDDRLQNMAMADLLITLLFLDGKVQTVATTLAEILKQLEGMTGDCRLPQHIRDLFLGKPLRREEVDDIL
ncbi:Hypp576 [Branchiostoma lanceolatum]|uniref:Hypp576 protein n=1 Tax=Branchiostoma lanceolatum TaxID=7740 RepID=A0A8J9YLI0_BRALA|nr:Hypp576 [Branchiostoma lanceolatum]